MSRESTSLNKSGKDCLKLAKQWYSIRVKWFYFWTRNAFCGTRYPPHSHVHNERTVPIIMAGCITHARNGRISIFHFRWKLWRHHRVSRPRFPIRRENFGDSAINKSYIATFSLRMRKTAVFPLPVWNMTLLSCCSTQISFTTRKFRQFTYI